MTALGVLSYTLEVPDLDAGVSFYTDAGLVAEVIGNRASLRCAGQKRAVVHLIGGAPRKRLHHVELRGDSLDFDATRQKIIQFGGVLIDAPAQFDLEGIWFLDPHGMCVHLSGHPDHAPLADRGAFQINGPGTLARVNRAAIPPKAAQLPVAPLRLGHVMVFSPDVHASVAFYSDALGLGLTDHTKDIIAFMCARRNSDHHILGFGKSDAIGFHHSSFQVADPDDVGRGGYELNAKAKRHHWGFGRHTIGSNFFHYVQDPWGSWFEYYSDIDFIEDYSCWTPTDYAEEDMQANWGPETPDDFAHNYEADSAAPSMESLTRA